jgi:hypothetical protein
MRLCQQLWSWVAALARCGAVAAGIAGAWALVGAAPETDRRASEDFLKLLIERNVFDPNRRAQREGARPPVAVRPRAESLSLIGTLLHDDQAMGFFSGSSAAFQQVLSRGDEIGGLRVTHITAAGVILVTGDGQVELAVGEGLRRVGEAPWALADRASDESPSAEGSLGPESSSAEGGEIGAKASPEVNEVLRRMLERRRQEQTR